MKKIILFLAFSLSAMTTYAGGFQVALQGVRQLGMGHVGTANTFNATSIYFNPGALAFHDSMFSANLGFYPIFGRLIYLESSPGIYQAEQVHNTGTPFSAYFSLSPNILDKKLKFGLGIYTPFGSSSQWEDDWKGRYVIQQVDLKTIFIQPTISYRINDKIGLGVGFVYNTGSLLLRKAIPLSSSSMADGQAELTGKGSGIGFNAGISFKATDDFSIGLTHKSSVLTKVKDGDATFTVPASVVSSFPSGTFNAELKLPNITTIGLAYQFTSKLNIATDINYTGWKSYDTLKIDLTNNTSTLADIKNTKNWNNTFTFRLGAEYMASSRLALRLGAYYDMTAAKSDYISPETPDANKLVITAGLSYRIKAFTIDLALASVNGSRIERTNPETNFGGNFKSKAIIPAIGINYDFKM